MKISHEINSIDMFFKSGVWNKGMHNFHWHEKLEIVQCIDKGFAVITDGQRFEVKEGDLIIIGEQIIHSFYAYEDETKFRLGQFPVSILLNNGIVPEAIKPVITKEELDSVTNLSQHINNILDVIQNEGCVEIGQKNPVTQNMYSALYFLLMRHFPAESKSRIEKKEKQEFYKIIEYINKNYTQNITVQSIAKDLYMDRGRLSSLFLKYTGMKLNYYINTLRISHASKLLTNGASVAETAMECGYQSIRTFTESYKKIMGTTPGKNKTI